jgi:hypothetical protein
MAVMFELRCNKTPNRSDPHLMFIGLKKGSELKNKVKNDSISLIEIMIYFHIFTILIKLTHLCN